MASAITGPDVHRPSSTAVRLLPLAIVNATQKDAMGPLGQYRRLVKLTDARCRLTDFYIKQVKKYSKRMQRITHNMVGDAAFSTKHFTDSMVELGFTFVSRLRKDKAVRYLYAGKKTGKRASRRHLTDTLTLRVRIWTECRRSTV